MIAKTKIAGLMVVLMALSAPMVYADNGSASLTTGGGGDKGSWHHGQQDHMFAKILNLTDDQQKQLKDSWQKQKEAMKSVFEQIKTNREAFNAEIVKATPDMSQITTIQTQIKTLQAQMVDNQLSSMLEIKKIMTPEQFAGYMALKKERMMMKHMMGHGKFGRKDGDGHQHWGNKGDGDHDSDSQD